VIPVVLYHAGINWVSGGFVGVDVFFVISGYLITSLILQEEARGQFGLFRFYERRARRILPALFAMMLACIPFAYLWMTPNQLKYFGEGIAAVSLFVSNILFFFHGGYFAAPASLNPLLHTWSLAVEEQFYLLFPLVLIFVWKFGRVTITALIAFIALLSFAFAHLGGSFTVHFPFVVKDWSFVASDFCFYLTPARAWELMAGVLIAIWSPDRITRPRAATEIAAAIGLLAILCAIFTYDRDTPFPSYYTLLPVLGTIFVILFAGPETWTGRLLSHRAFVGIGLISYSVYLWHLPLLAFARIHGAGESDAWLIDALTLISVPLGYLTWRYIETPFRTKGKFSRAQIFGFVAAGSLFFITVGGALIATRGLIYRFPAKDWSLLEIDPGTEGMYVVREFSAHKGDFKDNGRKKILVIGDSFAEDFMNMLSENHLLESDQVRTFGITAKCQIIIPEPNPRLCREHSLLGAAIQARIKQADIIILASSWLPETAARLDATLGAAGISQMEKRVYVLGTKNFGPILPLSYLPLTTAERIALRNPVPHLDANDLLRKALPPTEFVDVEKIVCGSEATCPAFTPDGSVISFDGSHLTPAGAKYVGSLLFGQAPLKSLTER
jgi:peptidoglycan/LPS O-acetylase OafA/YrhL